MSVWQTALIWRRPCRLGGDPVCRGFANLEVLHTQFWRMMIDLDFRVDLSIEQALLVVLLGEKPIIEPDAGVLEDVIAQAIAAGWQLTRRAGVDATREVCSSFASPVAELTASTTSLRIRWAGLPCPIAP